MFESLTEKLNGVFNRLGNQGRLTERDVDSALREIRMALLEADVNFRVARSFVGKIRERALSEDVLQSLSPGQQVVKITNEEMTAILDGGENKVVPGPSAPSVILMIGLNGSGKTTTSAKLARHLKHAGQLPVLVAADLNRPAAIDQLQTLGQADRRGGVRGGNVKAHAAGGAGGRSASHGRGGDVGDCGHGGADADRRRPDVGA